MAGILSRFSRRPEPMPRIWQTSWQVGCKVLLHSGRTRDYSEKTKQRLASLLDVFDLYTELWQQKKVTGAMPPPGVYWAASVSVDEGLFTFGGRDDNRRYNSLHKLTDAMQWVEVCPHNERTESPIAKAGAGMVAFDENLAVVGGYGTPHGPAQPGSSFISNTDGAGWTNEFHIYSLNNDLWLSPDITGERPPPCAGLTLTSIDSRRAILFGGWNGQQGAMNDVYIIDLLTMHWIKFSKTQDGSWPEERLSHAACCLNYGQQHPQLLVTGGMNKQGMVLGDAWILDVDCVRWRKVSDGLQPRFGHSATAFNLLDGVTEVTMFGGSADPLLGNDEKQSKLADTTLLQFRCSGHSEWEPLSVVHSSDLGSEVRVFMKKKWREEREIYLEMRSQRAERRVQMIEKKLQIAEMRAQNTEEMFKRANERAQHAERKIKETEERVKRERKWVMQERGRAHVAEERVQQAEARVVKLQRRLGETEKNEEERLVIKQQVISTNQIGETMQQKSELEQQKREMSHITEWRVHQAEFLAQVAEARASSLQWRLDMVQGREQARLEVQKLENETKQARERAQQAEERVQKAEKRVQRESEWMWLETERAREVEERAELRVDEPQRTLGEAEKRILKRTSVQQQAESTKQAMHIRGADVVAETTLEVAPGTPFTFVWTGHGLKLHIPADALKPSTATLTMSIQASLSGQYHLPDDTELVSGIYWVAFPQKFSRPVTIELQHCASLDHHEHLSSLSFLTAKCNQKALPYQFKPLSGGVFSSNTCYGSIELSHFSAFGIGWIWGKEKKEKCYTAKIFYIPQEVTTWLMHFTIFCDLELCCKEVEGFYSKQGAEAGPYLEVMFNEDEVSLDVPKEGIKLPSGWSIQPLIYPTRLLKKSIDNYQPGRTIHSCQLELVWKEPAERLSHMLLISGVIPAGTYTTITRNPTLPGSPKIQSHIKKAKPDNEHPAQLGFRHKPSLSLLMNLVGWKVKNKWYEIGSGLGVKESDLVSIQAEEAGKTDAIQRCMQHVFNKWESAITSEYTWQNLANMLESPAVNEKAAVQTLYMSLSENKR